MNLENKKMTNVNNEFCEQYNAWICWKNEKILILKCTKTKNNRKIFSRFTMENVQKIGNKKWKKQKIAIALLKLIGYNTSGTKKSENYMFVIRVYDRFCENDMIVLTEKAEHLSIPARMRYNRTDSFAAGVWRHIGHR